MDKAGLKEVKRVANELKPQFNIGKSGLTETFIETVEKYLDAHQIVKIKALNAVDKTQVSDMAQELAKKIDAELIDKKGFTFVLYRE